MLFAVAFISCGPNSKEAKHETPKEEVAAAENPYKGLKFDNKHDFYCEMDIEEYGAGDTLHYKGKLYGFCSKTCKDAFLKDPESYLGKVK